MMAENPSLAFGSAIGFFIAALFNSILAVWKETDEGVEEALVNAFGHHWIGHGILVLIVFIIVTLIVSFVYKVDEIDESKSKIMIILIVAGSILTLLIIGGFMMANFAAEAEEAEEFIMKFLL